MVHVTVLKPESLLSMERSVEVRETYILHDENTSWKLTAGGGGGLYFAHSCAVRSLLFHAFLGLTNGCTGPCAFTLGWRRHGNNIQGV